MEETRGALIRAHPPTEAPQCPYLIRPHIKLSITERGRHTAHSCYIFTGLPFKAAPHLLTSDNTTTHMTQTSVLGFWLHFHDRISHAECRSFMSVNCHAECRSASELSRCSTDLPLARQLKATGETLHWTEIRHLSGKLLEELWKRVSLLLALDPFHWTG